MNSFDTPGFAIDLTEKSATPSPATSCCLERNCCDYQPQCCVERNCCDFGSALEQRAMKEVFSPKFRAGIAQIAQKPQPKPR